MQILTKREMIIGRLNAAKVAHRHSDAVAYLYTAANGQPAAIAFHGRAQKPAFWLRFRSEAAREAHIRDYFEACRQRIDRRRQSRKPHRFEPGHILVSTWGYEQTNVDFYQVTRVVSPQTIEVRPIGSTTIQDTGWAQGRCIPLIDHFTGEPMLKRPQDGDTIKIESYSYARLWDGKPVAWTSYH